MHNNIIVASLMLLLAVLASFHCLIYQYQCPNGHKITALDMFLSGLEIPLILMFKCSSRSIIQMMGDFMKSKYSWQYADHDDCDVGEPAE